VDARIGDRRKRKREEAEEKKAAEDRAKNPKLQTQFADLKRGLASLNDADWESIPEAGNLTGKRRKHNMRMEENQNGKSYAVSDSVLAGVSARGQMLGELDAAQQEVSLGIRVSSGFDTPAGDGTMTDFVSIGTARDKVLSLRLDQASKDAANGSSTSIDPRGYMTALNSQVLQTDAQIG
jgi:pre-mRNA-processing factor 6